MARLDRAIRALDQACDELRDNVSAWRAGINALTINLGKIAENLQFLDTGLTAASSQLQRGGKEEFEAEPQQQRCIILSNDPHTKRNT